MVFDSQYRLFQKDNNGAKFSDNLFF